MKMLRRFWIMIEGKINQKIEAALFEHYGTLLEITQSPHGNEIYDEHHRLCGELLSKILKIMQLVNTSFDKS